YATPETVVIVKSSIPDGFINLKGKKFCHPGFKHDELFSHLLLKEFEYKITELNDSFCSNDNHTLLEKHVQSLSQFFGESCRPGLWTQNVNFDKILKERYSSLCSLCGTVGCDINYEIPFNDSLKCLSSKDADVAVTTIYEGYKFFNISGNAQNYKYLCKDGSSRSSTAPCTWSSELPDLIVVEKSVADTLKTYLQNNLKSKVHNLLTSENIPPEITEQALIDILKLKRATISLLNKRQSLKDYVQERRTIPTFESSKECDRTLKWCTYSDMEQEKCKWLSQAAMNWGIQPVVECKRSEGTDELSCLDDIKKKYADVVVASSDYAYISLSKGLKSIAFPDTMTTNLSIILTVKRSDDDSIKKFEDLKGKKVCLPRYGGKEHVAFIDTIRKLKINDEEKCDYGKLLNDFVGPSCTPGVRSSLIKESTEYVDQDKLCSVCRPINVTRTSTFCNDNFINKYFGSDGALECLYDKVGDFAVISKLGKRIALRSVTEFTEAKGGSNYQVICKNNTLSSIHGIDVDTNCALNVITSSEVVSQADNSKNPDIILALREFERWFGQNLDKSFHLFDRFNETLDLLFKDSTAGLAYTDNEYIRNYKELLQNVKDCT
ncbi:transferrin-like, partial [Asbolus verrucosus]